MSKDSGPRSLKEAVEEVTSPLTYGEKVNHLGKATSLVVEAGVLMEKTRALIHAPSGHPVAREDVEATERAAWMLRDAAAHLQRIADSVPPPAEEKK